MKKQFDTFLRKRLESDNVFMFVLSLPFLAVCIVAWLLFCVLLIIFGIPAGIIGGKRTANVIYKIQGGLDKS